MFYNRFKIQFLLAQFLNLHYLMPQQSVETAQANYLYLVLFSKVVYLSKEVLQSGIQLRQTVLDAVISRTCPINDSYILLGESQRSWSDYLEFDIEICGIVMIHGFCLLPH